MADPERLDRATARASLPPFFDPIQALEFLPSTMSLAAELADGGAPEGATVLADHQTAGRGRLGRVWLDRPGASLLLSVVLRPATVKGRAWVLAAAGVALVEAAAELLPPAVPVALKWPNDLLVAQRKAAGMLAEGRGGALVLGLGVNVGQAAGDFPPELRGQVTSLAEAGRAAGAPAGGITRAALLAAWGHRFEARYRSLGPDGAGVLGPYRRRLGTLGRRVRVGVLGAAPVEGVAEDVAADGALVVRRDDGVRVRVAAGDVEHLRPAG